MVENVCTVLLLNTFDLISKGCFGFSVNSFGVVEALVDDSESAILPFIEEVTHVSFHKPLYHLIDSFVFPDSNVIIDRCVLDIVETFVRHTFLKHVDGTDQEGTLLTHRNPPALKNFPLSTDKIKRHISSSQRSPCLLNLNFLLLYLLKAPCLCNLGLLSHYNHFISIID